MERRTAVRDAPQAIKSLVVSIGDLEPNPWNPNRMDGFTYTKALESIQAHGFLDPVTCRPHPSVTGRWQIIDGEHRWRAGVDLGLDTVPIVSLGKIDDETAMKLTIVLNELRGQYEPRAMGDLLTTLLSNSDLNTLSQELPFTMSTLEGLTGLEGIVWPTPELREAVKKGEDSKKERWVERTFRLPMSANVVLQQALDKAKDGMDVSDVLALEYIAAEFIGSK